MQNDLQQITQRLIDAFPAMSASQQALALRLYRELGKGMPVSNEQLAAASGQDIDAVHDTLAEWPGVFRDQEGRVTGFWGLSVEEMPHRLTVGGVTLYAWCAWDTLFLPRLLDAAAEVVSTYPVTETRLHLNISPRRVEAGRHPDMVVSFLTPAVDELTRDITTSFCHFVYFFPNRLIGEQWRADHPDTFLLGLDEAFEVGRQLNLARYSLTLASKDT